MELDLNALQQLPAEEEQAGVCGYSCQVSCPNTCAVTGR
ncbi:ALQxL family class IV lanthipeptide [Streptomyces vinaceus]|nr:ALQxL family class IV lanthipeptide [Streptomyces vinaceus]